MQNFKRGTAMADILIVDEEPVRMGKDNEDKMIKTKYKN